MKTVYRIGFFQPDIVWGDIEANLNKLKIKLSELQKLPHIVILPEMFTTGFIMSPDKIESSRLKNQIAVIQKYADDFQVSIICSIAVKDAEAYYNRMYLFRPVLNYQYYNKRHLFSIGGEQLSYEKGMVRQIFSYDKLRIFPQVCYDLRFPVWSRNDTGYHLLVNVANWPASRQDVWKTLLKARALENQCYVIGVNRVGADRNGIDYTGGSIGFNAKGEELMDLGPSETYGELNIDLNALDEFRLDFPVLQDADEFRLK